MSKLKIPAAFLVIGAMLLGVPAIAAPVTPLSAAVLAFQKLPPCLVDIEACASSHHWSCELQALGHTVRLMSLT